MATTNANHHLDINLDAGRSFFHQMAEQLRGAIAKRKAYRAIFAELSALNDRELSDLGILRFNIDAIARDAANDI